MLFIKKEKLKDLRLNHYVSMKVVYLLFNLLKYYLVITIVIDALNKCDLEKQADLLETLEVIF